MKKKQMDLLIEALNHKVTKLETSVKWIKLILGYMAIITTAGVISALF